MMTLEIAVDDPQAEDVLSLLETHLQFANEVTPAGHVHALGVEGLVDPAVTFFSARSDGELLGVGALKQLSPTHGELKSMHSRAVARGRGVGRAILQHVLLTAKERKYDRVSLETGTYVAFAPARALYESAGFEPCPPFAQYTANRHSVCMTIKI